MLHPFSGISRMNIRYVQSTPGSHTFPFLPNCSQPRMSSLHMTLGCFLESRCGRGRADPFRTSYDEGQVTLHDPPSGTCALGINPKKVNLDLSLVLILNPEYHLGLGGKEGDIQVGDELLSFRIKHALPGSNISRQTTQTTSTDLSLRFSGPGSLWLAISTYARIRRHW